MKWKKTLMAFLFGISLTGFRYDELGDLQDYKTTYFFQREFLIKNIPILLRFYNPRNDGIDDVVEYYKKNELDKYAEPFLYVFDKNNNGLVDKGEILVDKNEDGINGNESWR